jgi:DNA-binding NarL/FixJ family response regulator
VYSDKERLKAMLTVYIVDDSDAMRERLAELASDIAGIEVMGQSGNPFDALNSIKKEHPDIVILDIRLPGRSGVELLKDIKRESPAPIVIMITNYPHRQYRQGCMSAGADYFFSKINEFDMIRETLRRIELDHQNKIVSFDKDQKQTFTEISQEE